jgi:chemotaxis protein MotB
MMKLKRVKDEEGRPSSTGWITTYTDLMILLLTFFVLLLSLSVIDSRKQRLALNSLVGAFGFKPGANAVMGEDKGLNITAGAVPMTKEEIDFESLQNVILKNGLEFDVEIRREREKIIISLGNRVLFERDSFQIEPKKVGFLDELASVLRTVPNLVELRGYVEPLESLMAPDPLNAAMFLSARRSLAVLHFLGERGRVPFSKMVAHGFGTGVIKKDPGILKPEDSRQIEIICDYRSKLPYRLREAPPEKDIPLDFKGFQFDLKEGQGD